MFSDMMKKAYKSIREGWEAIALICLWDEYVTNHLMIVSKGELCYGEKTSF